MYSKIFTSQLSKILFKFSSFLKSTKLQDASDTSASRYGFDPNFVYYILYASYGDKWCILSFIDQFLTLHENIKIIANSTDMQLLRIFIGENRVQDRIVFVDTNKLRSISDSINPLSEVTKFLWLDLAQLVQTNAVIQIGFNKNTIRHLHLVKYPYFADLHIIHGVSYASLLKMLLYLPGTVQALGPSHYLPLDLEETKNLISKIKNPDAKFMVLFNVVNISHASFSLDQILLIIKTFEKFNIQVIINSTLHPDLSSLYVLIKNTKMAKTIEIPPHLFALFCNEFTGVVGILGGAMNVAVQFSNAHCLSFYTEGTGFDLTLQQLYGGKYSDNIWKLYDQDWPCFQSGRIIKNLDIGNPKNFDNNALIKLISNFSKEIS